MGGGINGCALARELALLGVEVALVEKRDFGSGVTSRSTRLIHGGLRYLESMQLGLVRESLRDREWLLRRYPGQIVRQPFVLPVYRGDSRPPWYLGLGLWLYRALARGSELPSHRRLSARETSALVPGLDRRGLLGGFEYYDCQAVYPERLALEMALEAEQAGAIIRNHAKAVAFVSRGSRVEGVQVATPHGTRTLSCRLVANAAGAWVDELLRLLPNRPRRPLLGLVNGAHIAVSGFPGAPASAVYREARSDRRPFFVVPWRGLYLIGTTEIPYSGRADDAWPEEGEIRYLLDETNALFPSAGLRPESVVFAYSGSRPLLRADAGDANRAPRGHALVDHARADGIEGLVTLAGGKLTTAPSFAASSARQIVRRLGAKPAPPPRGKGDTRRDARSLATSGWAKSRGRRPAGSREIAAKYGTRSAELLEFVASASALQRPLADGCGTTVGEIVFAVQREKAQTLGDIVLRRTGLAFDPSYQPTWARRAAEVAAPHLGWDDRQAGDEIQRFERELAGTLRRDCRPAGLASSLRVARAGGH